VTIADDAMLEVARQRMQQLKLKALVAVNSRGRVTGIVEVFDDN
jgi:CBS-domain-containing membrane protein